MGVEVERKFLVRGEAWRSQGTPVRYRQGYLSADPERVVRVRTAGEQAWITIKGAGRGPSRPEFEYPIPRADADALLDGLCQRPLIDKERREIAHAGLTWVVDEFFGDNEGLVMAEVELDHPEQPVALPPWVGDEVTDDPRYYNASLVARPYRLWKP